MEKSEESTGFNAERLPAPDVTMDPIGLISGTPADADSFDLPEQRMDSGAPTAGGVGKYPVKLKDDAFRRVIDAFEKKLTTEFFYPSAEGTITYGDALIHQAGHFRKVIEGEAEVYLPLLLK